MTENKRWLSGFLLTVGIAAWVGCAGSAFAVDHFITIGGGYSPQGNQASMEANVKFFEVLLSNEFPDHSKYHHQIFFSDGNDPDVDVQVAERLLPLSATANLIAETFEWDTEQTFYRNHEIKNVSGANRAGEIQRALTDVSNRLVPGDRLFVYVTAHGGKSKSKNSHDTSVYGWDREVFRSSEFSDWLTAVPTEVPVYMVMAQCYCGGFSHSIFQSGDASQPLAEGLRCGFFAQQHDLPAAGCRPDISNDQEYSSYFWGAIMGSTRNGEPITTADQNGDGCVSLGEAHVYAVIAGETIDIPFRSSEALLRVYSRMLEPGDDGKNLLEPSGQILGLLENAGEIDRWIVEGLASELNLPLTTTVEELRFTTRDSRGNRRRGRDRGRSAMQAYQDSLGRLKDEILQQWPELEKVESVGGCNNFGISLDEIATEIGGWDSFKEFETLIQQKLDSKESANDGELRRVKMKRMLQAIETIVLAKNLPLVADSDVNEKYMTMLKMENEGL